eukprot:GHVT01010312.1.p1 GENE.GHVT01010312.1~~GHVT01010312.1.p1  ORF type:complete len:212 (-),score=37.32 GHVT01010312.1:1085-1720(-)
MPPRFAGVLLCRSSVVCAPRSWLFKLDLVLDDKLSFLISSALFFCFSEAFGASSASIKRPPSFAGFLLCRSSVVELPCAPPFEEVAAVEAELDENLFFISFSLSSDNFFGAFTFEAPTDWLVAALGLGEFADAAVDAFAELDSAACDDAPVDEVAVEADGTAGALLDAAAALFALFEVCVSTVTVGVDGSCADQIEASEGRWKESHFKVEV